MFLDHVLIPLSGSEAAEELLDWARSLIHSEGKISLVRVINDSKYGIREKDRCGVIGTVW